MATTESSRTNVRKQGIDFVNSIKSFLSTKEYVSAMEKATGLYPSEDSELSIAEAVLGIDRANEIQARSQRQQFRDKLLTSPISEIVMNSFLDKLASGCSDEPIDIEWLDNLLENEISKEN